MSFRKAIHDKKIVPPNKPSFSSVDWASGFNKIDNPTDDDKMLLISGVFFFGIFEKLRENIYLLNEKIPKNTNENIIKLHCGISNSNLMKLEKTLVSNSSEVQNMYVPEDFKSLGYDVSLPPQDIAEGIVDSIHYALSVRVGDLKMRNSSSNSIETHEFLRLNAAYSELYLNFESYWQGIIWGSYILELGKGKVIIKQLETKENIAYAISLNRKTKIDIENSTFNDYQINIEDNVLTYRQGKITIRKAESLNDIHKVVYRSLISSSEIIKNDFPKNFIQDNIKNKNISINDVIKVFINLVIFSKEVYESLKEIEILESRDFLKVCPEFKTEEISKRISEITGLRFDRVNEVIDFLTFKSSKNDLWSHPIIMLKNNNLTILLSSITSPNLRRVIEYWLRDSYKDISKKGGIYENTLIDSINNRLSKNPIFTDHDLAKSIKFKSKKVYEEIDCVFRFGKIVVVCEAKSIITVDSEISKFNTIKALNKASEQVIRKADFIESNLQDFFVDADWFFDKSVGYKIVPIIINSNKIFVSGLFGGIPVVDELILSNFFRKGTSSLLTDSSGKDLLWFNIYTNFDEAQLFFELYLKKLPQISLDSRYLEKIKRNSFERHLNIGVDIEVENITFKKYTLNDIINAKYDFPLIRCKDYDSRIKVFEKLV